eukprot:scaffold1811_cov411-Prasinococcus_capsulatus_cf.AAC.17
MQEQPDNDEKLLGDVYNNKDPRKQQQRLKGWGKRAVNTMNNNAEGFGFFAAGGMRGPTAAPCTPICLALALTGGGSCVVRLRLSSELRVCFGGFTVLLNMVLRQTDEDLKATAITSLVHFGSRIVHAAAYIGDNDMFRSAAFSVGLAANLVNYGFAFAAASDFPSD